MLQPTDVDGKLMRLGPRQQHAIVERMQEPPLADPAFFFHQDSVHDRDLSRRTAKA